MEISDNELMFQVFKGETDKIGLLYERYNKMLFAYFFKLTGMLTISEDLVNDTFLKILKCKSRYRGDGLFRAWMFKVARSVFSDNYKKMKPIVLTNGYEETVLNKHHDNDASEEYEKIEKQQLLHKALLMLPHKERELLILSNFNELKYNEIAKMMNCSEGAVKVRIFRAIQKLKVIYERIQN